MLRIGITGGIGSGKTTVCRIFASLGIPVYNADQRAKWLMSNDKELIEAIKSLFGPEAYYENGQLNRQHLSDIIFSEPKKREQLNAIVHPAVWQDGDRWNAEHPDAPYTLKEAALIFESGGHKHLNKVIVITAPEDLRITRVVRRDGVERAAVKARIAAQMPESEKVSRADFVIFNDGHQMLIPQVLQIHRQLIAMSGGEAG
ncbi:dephospho-CoA kinase [Flavilitoribacter nigricans]|uniref:Dephospho-CoA kinase n=1 Tax=Flavilitoribacter nigricans (strain ATCC 23147 / DSM 23189 / NBRC 102662 / NCIMB 1420 / SS-2) TaxID=1122177 RepID=A0A2D0NIU2_FLAN2|nr:dephospho-CoA kinase [Flavilitoribacter nigricans]PHN08412.1 dephospho-CoA kinase [Flavilitoribacter nigricans DSM 23189 = NBRC 102662]